MKKGLKSLIFVTLFILTGFLIKALFEKNYEFLGYWIVIVVVFSTVIVMDKKFNFPLVGMWLFSIWSILHMAGGLIKINGTRLYDTILIPILGDPFFILRYDQFIHTYCYIAISILVYFALKNYTKNKKALFAFTMLASMGIGALNEIIEFSLVIFANAGAGVGGYFNNALDLVFNLIGAIGGSWIASKIKK